MTTSSRIQETERVIDTREVTPTLESIIECTENGNQTIRAAYPSHIYDPIRRRIATEIMGKEIAKLIKSEGNDELRKLRNQIDELFDTESILNPPVREFWSMFDALTLAKTKRLGQFVTAGNVQWESGVSKVDDLSLTWMPFIESRPKVFGSCPWPIPRLREAFAADQNLYAEAQASNSKNLSEYRFKHSEEPIILLRTPTSQELLDGNGRLYRLFMEEKDEVNCWIGTLKDRLPKDYWVNAGTLKNLCHDVVDNEEMDAELSAASLILLRNLLYNNKVARVTYDLWLRKDFLQLENRLED